MSRDYSIQMGISALAKHLLEVLTADADPEPDDLALRTVIEGYVSAHPYVDLRRDDPEKLIGGDADV
jgi:hypothetical protein